MALYTPLPGRLNQLEMMLVSLHHFPTGIQLDFHMVIGNHMVICSYDLLFRTWHILLDGACFRGIKQYPEASDMVDRFTCIAVIRQLLTDVRPKEAEQIKALKEWRDILQLYPAKLLSLNNK